MGASDSVPTHLQADQILIALRRIIRAIDLHSRRLVRESGLTGPQLVVLREAGARTEVSGSTLAKAVSVSLPTLSGIVARLADRGLVERKRNSRDKREVLISVTEAGQELLVQAPSPLQATFIRRWATLEEWEQTQMLAVLQRIVSMMEADELDASPILTTGGMTEQSGAATQEPSDLAEASEVMP